LPLRAVFETLVVDPEALDIEAFYHRAGAVAGPAASESATWK